MKSQWGLKIFMKMYQNKIYIYTNFLYINVRYNWLRNFDYNKYLLFHNQCSQFHFSLLQILVHGVSICYRYDMFPRRWIIFFFQSGMIKQSNYYKIFSAMFSLFCCTFILTNHLVFQRYRYLKSQQGPEIFMMMDKIKVVTSYTGISRG